MSSTDDLTIERLTAHAGFARAIARGLLRDESSADDVLQDAYLAALERPPERNARAWFATVARRLSLNAMRGTRRRVAREAEACVADPPASPADIAARRDALRTVFEAVLALDEPFQSVVLLRFYEDLAPAQIAVRLGVPAATVRTRLHRALGMLRERLDEHDDRAAWCAALAPVAGLGRRSPAPTVGAAAVVGGVIAMKNLLVACVVLLALGLGSWVLNRGEVREIVSSAKADAAPASRNEPGRRAVAPRDGKDGEKEKPAPAVAEAAAAPAESGPAHLAGRVLDELTGEAAAGADVFVLAGEGSRKELDAAKPRARAAADGRFVCANLAVGAHHVTARAPGRLDAHAHAVEATEGEGREPRLVLAAPHAIAGHVVAPSGVSVREAKASCTIPNDRLAKWAWWTNVGVEASVAADGSFVLADLPRREFDVHAELKLSGRRWSAGALAIEIDGAPVVLTLEDATEPTRHFRLRVLDPSGRPVKRFKVRRYMFQWCGAWQGPNDEVAADDTVEIDLPEIVRTLWYEPYAWTDDAGRDVAAAPSLVAFEVAKDAEKSVRLEPGAALCGHVLDPAGRGVAGAKIDASADVLALAGSLRLAPHGRAVSDEAGAFRIDGLARIGYRLVVDAPPDFLPVAGVRANPGEPAEITLVAALRPVVVVLDADGRPVADADVSFDVGEREIADASTDTDGRARLDRVPPGQRGRLSISAGDRFASVAVADWTPVDATFRLPPALVVWGTVVDRQGAPVPGARVSLRREGARDEEDDTTNDRGVFFFGRLAPGDVRLFASVIHDDPPADAPTTVVHAGEKSVVLVVDPGVVLRARIDNWGDRDPSLIWPSPTFIEDGPAPARVHYGEQQADRLSFAGLRPGCTGTILFGPMTGDFVVFQQGVRADAGAVNVRFARGKTLEGRIAFPPDVSPYAADTQVVADVLGVEVGGRSHGGGRWSIRGVPDGTWTVHAKLALDDKTYEASAQATPGVAVDLELR